MKYCYECGAPLTEKYLENAREWYSIARSASSSDSRFLTQR